ncbi:MAG: thiamine phosphate synthase [Burkholderiaceae bacterium]|jgi:thiamine-phosphate pyrophosphorylase|nr:thiamine phosphate synthase [Burkholderiaceae bacterium]
MFELNTDARAIVAAHADKAIPVSGTPALNYSRDDAGYRSAKQACLALGFIEIDAECVALAWLAQANRTRQFDPQAWPAEPADFGLRPWPRQDAFPACPKHLGVYAVLPTAEWVGRMARAGVPTLQLRYKSEDAAAVQREVQAAVNAVRGTNALLFINDHWREAIAAGAYGVHLGQEDMEIADFAAIRAAGLRLGLSSHGYAEMVRADRLSPSYIAMGAVYPTTLKRMATAPQGPGRLAAYARLMRDYPGVGIGGISAAELPEIKATGVGSLAVVRAITAQNNPEQAAQDLMAAWAA